MNPNPGKLSISSTLYFPWFLYHVVDGICMFLGTWNQKGRFVPFLWVVKFRRNLEPFKILFFSQSRRVQISFGIGSPTLQNLWKLLGQTGIPFTLRHLLILKNCRLRYLKNCNFATVLKTTERFQNRKVLFKIHATFRAKYNFEIHFVSVFYWQ